MNPTLKKLALMLSYAVALAIFGGRESAAQFILGKPTRLGRDINRGDDFWPDISADGLTVYFTRGDPRIANSEIFVATRDSMDGPWTSAQPLGPPVNTNATEGSPAISPDGQELYFADIGFPEFRSTLRPGGIGGGDI